MRLTLRTLLAYMHDLLPPEDAEEIARKIEESDVAKALVRRIRDVMRRIRLGAPDPLAQEDNLDANTVAEYLDHALPPDQVPDFERLCLESDTQLAEVAACHQILAMVLGQPAEVDPQLRQKMYELPARLEQQQEAETQEVVGAESADVSQLRTEPVAPCADGRRQLVRLLVPLLGLLLLLIAGGIILTWTGQIQPGKWLAKIFVGGQQSAVRAPQTVPASQPVQKGASGEEPSQPTPTGTGSAEKNLPATETASPETEQPEKTSAEQQGEQQLQQPEGAAVTPEPVGTQAKPAVPSAEPSQPEQQAEQSESSAQGDVEEQQAAPVPAEVVGRLTAENEFLLEFDPQTNQWLTVLPGGQVKTNRIYVSVPDFRPVVLLGNGMRLVLVDHTQLMLQKSEDQLSVRLEFGRVLFVRGRPSTISEAIDLEDTADAGQDGQQADQPQQEDQPEQDGKIQVIVAGKSGTLSLESDPCLVGLEAIRNVPPEVDPATDPGTITWTIFVAEGKAVWTAAQTPPIALTAPMQLVISDRLPEAKPLQDTPEWAKGGTVGQLQMRGKPIVVAQLGRKEIPTLALRELAEDPRREVHRLAVQSLASLGQFDVAIRILNDPEREREIDWYVDLLMRSVQRSPQLAAAVRGELERLFGPDGTEIYELLWRYHAGNLDRRSAEHIVNLLAHKRFAVRAVAFVKLTVLSEGKTFGYEPNDSPPERARAIERWQQWIRSRFPDEGQEDTPVKDTTGGQLMWWDLWSPRQSGVALRD